MVPAGDRPTMSDATKIVLATVGVSIVLVLAFVANCALA